jgi:hypothetical protein
MISDLSTAEIPTIIDAVSNSTAVLAVITYYYAKKQELSERQDRIQVFV